MGLADTIAELKASLAEVKPQQEGLRDFLRVDTLPATKVELNEALLIFNRRIDLMEAVLALLEALLSDGFPVIPVQRISQEAYNDLKEQLKTQQAAFTKFEAQFATGLGMTASGPFAQ